MNRKRASKITSTIRVRFVDDEEACFEECNGESRPLTEEEYRENPYRACPDHPRGSKAPARTEHGRAWCGDCGTEYEDIPYAEYLAYYGNPERHVYLGIVAEAQCPCCLAYTGKASSVWRIDFMNDSPELSAITVGEWMSAEDAGKLPGYAGELAREQIQEAEG